ncbi:MAG: excinuclease ABC subunit C [Deltaproteobacteria bacterium RIFOXYD12_FULL_55_16]|nr:MAG: excinuclease ABC subunit C [Deltaproteobacteria bacterium RIFOXYD12_FULL_55_16]
MPSFDFKVFLPGIPLQPGVYLMKNRAEEVLYVGKARELRKRLSSYARVDQAQHGKTAMLLSQVRGIETIVTNTEKEALILEASLIKQHRPKYNVILRDDKNYPLLKVTVQEDWPRLVMTRRRIKDGARYFGPFSSPAAMWETLRYLNSLFPLRRCKEKSLKPKARPCLNQQMGRCLAPCAGKVGQEEYQELVNNVLLVLEGKNQQLVKELSRKMALASTALRFEEAARLRDQIAALNKTLEKQQVVAAHGKDQDVLGFVRQEDSVAVALLFIRSGVISGQQAFFLAEPVGSDAEVLTEVLSRFYGEEERYLPQEILLPFAGLDDPLLAEWLSEQKGSAVAIACPQRGDRVRLLEMAKANAGQVLAARKTKQTSWLALAEALQKALGLARIPERIECLDISNLGGQQAVGSLVCFVAGEKAPECYRHYAIHRVSGPDDYAMMAEVLGRRFARGLAADNLPDLLLVDGGKGQLGVAGKALAELGDVPEAKAVELVGIAKEKAEEGEKLYRPGRKNPLLLARHSPALLYLMRIRDEAHRYGITLHRKLRQKESLTSALEQIPGVGKARRELLLRELGSRPRLAAASQAELAAVSGIGPALAALIWRHLHGDEVES